MEVEESHRSLAEDGIQTLVEVEVEVEENQTLEGEGIQILVDAGIQILEEVEVDGSLQIRVEEEIHQTTHEAEVLEGRNRLGEKKVRENLLERVEAAAVVVAVVGHRMEKRMKVEARESVRGKVEAQEGGGMAYQRPEVVQIRMDKTF